MTRFGYVMTTYVAMLVIVGADDLFQSRAEADLERQRQRADRTLRRAAGRRAPCRRTGRGHAARTARAASSTTRRYLPKGVPMLKHILALPGQTVCRTDRTITVDGIAMGEALERDSLGRPLPDWQGCRASPPAKSSS